jgi:hypothetical protein
MRPGLEAAASGPEAASTSPAATTDGGGSAFNPSAIGAMLGGSVDAGLSIGVTPQVADGCDALCAKEATANCPNQGSDERLRSRVPPTSEQPGLHDGDDGALHLRRLVDRVVRLRPGRLRSTIVACRR